MAGFEFDGNNYVRTTVLPVGEVEQFQLRPSKENRYTMNIGIGMTLVDLGIFPGVPATRLGRIAAGLRNNEPAVETPIRLKHLSHGGAYREIRDKYGKAKGMARGDSESAGFIGLKPGDELILGRETGLQILTNGELDTERGDTFEAYLISQLLHRDGYASRRHMGISVVSPDEVVITNLSTNNPVHITERVGEPFKEKHNQPIA